MGEINYHLEQLHGGSSDDDFRQLARLHREEIRDGFLSSLGEGFLSRLYQSLSMDANVYTVIARRNGEIIGYLCAAATIAGVYRQFLLRNAWRVAPLLLPRLCSIATLRRVAETLLYPARTSRSDLPGPEILNFCVSSRAQRCGVGRRLFQALCDEFTRRKVRQVRIVTGQAQISAQRFYESLGAVKVSEVEVHKTVRSVVYVYDLENAGRSAA